MSKLNWERLMGAEGEFAEDVPAEVADSAIAETEAVEAAEEVEADVETFEEFDENTNALEDDAQELEETKEALDENLEDPNFEIDEFAAEAIGIRLRRMARDRKFDFAGLERSFSAESFGSHVSNRRQRTELVSEGLGDAIKSMWEKIKAAIKASIDFVKDFFKKHISTIGRLNKSLEKLKRRARDLKGSPDNSKEAKVSGSLNKAFYGSNTLDTKQIEGVIANHKSAMEGALKVITETAGIAKRYDVAKMNEIIELVDVGNAFDEVQGKASFFKDTAKVPVTKFGDKDNLLVDGVFGAIESEGEVDSSIKITVKWDAREGKESERVLVIGAKSALESICDGAITILNYTNQMGKLVDTATSDFNKAMGNVNEVISKLDENISAPGRRAVNNLARGLRDTVRVVPKVSTKLSSLNVKLGKSVASYTSTCISKYTTK